MIKNKPTIFEFKPEKPPRGWKRKYGVFAFDGKDLWVPLGATGASDIESFLCASVDGVKILRTGKDTLVPEEWVRRVFPKMASALDAIRRNAEKAWASEEPEPLDNPEDPG